MEMYESNDMEAEFASDVIEESESKRARIDAETDVSRLDETVQSCYLLVVQSELVEEMASRGCGDDLVRFAEACPGAVGDTVAFRSMVDHRTGRPREVRRIEAMAEPRDYLCREAMRGGRTAQGCPTDTLAAACICDCPRTARRILGWLSLNSKDVFDEAARVLGHVATTTRNDVGALMLDLATKNLEGTREWLEDYACYQVALGTGNERTRRQIEILYEDDEEEREQDWEHEGYALGVAYEELRLMQEGWRGEEQDGQRVREQERVCRQLWERYLGSGMARFYPRLSGGEQAVLGMRLLIWGRGEMESALEALEQAKGRGRSELLNRGGPTDWSALAARVYATGDPEKMDELEDVLSEVLGMECDYMDVDYQELCGRTALRLLRDPSRKGAMWGTNPGRDWALVRIMARAAPREEDMRSAAMNLCIKGDMEGFRRVFLAEEAPWRPRREGMPLVCRWALEFTTDVSAAAELVGAEFDGAGFEDNGRRAEELKRAIPRCPRTERILREVCRRQPGEVVLELYRVCMRESDGLFRMTFGPAVGDKRLSRFMWAMRDSASAPQGPQGPQGSSSSSSKEWTFEADVAELGPHLGGNERLRRFAIELVEKKYPEHPKARAFIRDVEMMQ